MNLEQLLANEKRDFLIRANGGIAMPAAGCIYWIALTILGFYVSPKNWLPLAGIFSGAIFPLALLLAKPFKSDVMAKSVLNSLLLPALISMLMFWPLAFAGSRNDITFFPLALAVGMGLHWPVIGWMYGGKIFLAHGLSRTIGCTALWYIFPDQRFQIIPAFVAVVYFITIFGIKREVNLAIKEQSKL